MFLCSVAIKTNSFQDQDQDHSFQDQDQDQKVQDQDQDLASSNKVNATMKDRDTNTIIPNLTGAWHKNA